MNEEKIRWTNPKPINNNDKLEDVVRMRVISVRLPLDYMDKMDKLVLRGIFVSKSEVIRAGLRYIFEKYEEVLKSA